MRAVIIGRPFNAATDVIALRDFLADIVARNGQAGYLHVGDWLWRLFMREETTAAAPENIRIWQERAGNIVGYCWFTPPGMVDLQVDPNHPETVGLVREMVAWAKKRQASHPEWTAADLTADAFEHDADRIAILRSLGFERTGDGFYNLYSQSLREPAPPVRLPSSGTIRDMTDPGDIGERVAIHREVWHPSRFTETSYRNVRAAPGFRSELDLVAVAPDGRYAAYCICWYDPVNRIGEFEPVGTREAYRRQGYGRAVIFEGLRRLRELGAVEAMVPAYGSAEPANALYAACGFTVQGRFFDYRRPNDATAEEADR